MDTATILIAVVSLVVAGWTAWKSGVLQRHDVLLSRRLELHGLLQEADKLLLEYPQLLRAFMSSAQYQPVDTWSAGDRDLLDAFVIVYLNVFEAAHSVFAQTSRLDEREKRVRDAWHRTVVSFFADCPAARSAWGRHRATYYDEFRAFLDEAISRPPGVSAPMASVSISIAGMPSPSA
jgi:hypothetical protein